MSPDPDNGLKYIQIYNNYYEPVTSTVANCRNKFLSTVIFQILQIFIRVFLRKTTNPVSLFL